MTGSAPGDSFDLAREALIKVHERLASVIVGQPDLITQLLTAVFAPGHVLLEGPPGLGKTQLAKATARALGFELSRIQCTPDLMPADITGSEVLVEGQLVAFRPGPLFANLVLVDEINRATPRTQAAFLEAMQERQVSYLGERRQLPSPFWILATQNPIELEGTYPLPEAQLDRFLMKLQVGYPSTDTLLELTRISLDQEPASQVESVLDTDQLTRVLAQVEEVIIADAVKRAAIALVVATVPDHEQAHPLALEHVRYGASPRGLQALLKAARVMALLDGRAHVSVSDLSALAVPVLRHRLLLRFESEVEGVDVETLITEVAADRLQPVAGD